MPNLWEALNNAFEYDRSAARGEMTKRKLIVFRHDSHLGNARSGEQFEGIKISKKVETPISWNDYVVTLLEELKATLPNLYTN